MTARRFALYPVERPWWSFNDHAAVLDVVRRRQPRRVLEFGPGSSTLALIEGGALEIVACEDDPEWFAVHAARLVPAHPGVSLVAYTWSDPLTIPALEGQRFDLALIDGPRGPEHRPAVLRYALERCDAVLMPTESSVDPDLERHIVDISDAADRDVTIWRTGPLSGGFALVTQRC